MPQKEILRQAMSQVIPIADDEWAAIAPFILSKTLKKRENLLREGQVCREICFVMHGSLRQYHLIDGEEKSTFFYFEHQFACNYESVLSGEPSDVTIEALEDCTLLYFDKDILPRLYRLYPKFEAFGRLIAETVYRCAMERLKTFLLNSPEQRYRNFLQHADSQLIMERIPQHYIASYLGITPVSLSRIRARQRTEMKYPMSNKEYPISK
jgi:CRP-like cAMP-binding protein